MTPNDAPPPFADLLAPAQQDMRHAYLGGGPGMLASSIVWLAAGLATLHYGIRAGMWVLLGGGVLIHPLALLLTRLFKRPARHAPGNPLARVAMEGVAWMILSMLVALALGLLRADLFFPAMLLAIGGRYFSFATLYGDRIYWLVGLVLAITGWVLAAGGAHQAMGAFGGAAIELAFAVIIILRAWRT